ncbi:alpha/beta hydrolase [Amycolatopsis sp.]|uniref:alpha/beta hydrolase n=1 Tax=Amycolatopsis sp. TaxID=37632 RepID=UPI002CFBA450|nr:alpha/beta hydrolase [Amycolatopsis sp.]HVV08146.1 alpha/beta hydrolase [Amycolatopsis sp.]
MTVPRHAYDPELAAVAAAVPALDLTDPARARAVSRPPAGVSPDVRWRDAHADGVPVRVYQPPGAGPWPVVLHFHAGGYVTGSVEGSHAHCAWLSAEVGAVVVSVEYRLAPEYPFPHAFDDGMTALAWVHREAGALGADPARVAVHGRSAGGGLAARTAVEARDRGIPVAFQYLNCPQLDPVADGASMTDFHDTAFLTAETVRTAWRHYLGPDNGRPAPPLATVSAAHVPDLAGVAPAYLAAAEFDPLRDEAIAYAGRLRAAGVPAELHLFPGTFHCSAVVARSAAVSRRELAEEVAVLRQALAGEAR